MPDSSQIKEGAIPTISEPQKKINDVPPLVPIVSPSKPDITETVILSQSKNAKICRVCMSKTATKSIFDNVEDNITIMSTLMLIAYPLHIAKTDDLPKYICNPCLSKLKMAHYFRLKCLNTDKILKKQNESERKRKAIEIKHSTTPVKKSKPETPKSVVKVERGNFQNIFVKSVLTDIAIEKKMAEIHDGDSTSTSKPDDSESDSLESVLATLEGKEQFIIESTDVEPKTPDKEENKRVTRKKGKWNLPKPKTSSVFVETENESSSALRSEIGVFPAKIIKSVYNNNFCVADNYLFEFGLIKQGQR